MCLSVVCQVRVVSMCPVYVSSFLSVATLILLSRQARPVSGPTLVVPIPDGQSPTRHTPDGASITGPTSNGSPLTGHAPDGPPLTGHTPDGPPLTRPTPNGPPIDGPALNSPPLILPTPDDPPLTSPTPFGPPLARPTPDGQHLTIPTPDGPPLTRPTPDGPPLTRPTPDGPPISRPTPDGPHIVRPTPDGPPLARPTPDGPPLTRPTPDGPPLTRPTLDGPLIVRPTTDGPPLTRPTPDGPPLARPTPDGPPLTRPTPDSPPLAKPTPDGPPLDRPTPDGPPLARPTPDGPPLARPTPDGPPLTRPTPDGPPLARPTPDGPPHARPTPDGLPLARPTPDGPPLARPTPDGPTPDGPTPDGPTPDGPTLAHGAQQWLVRDVDNSSSGAVSINHSSSGAVSINHSSSGAISINHSSSGAVSKNHSSSGAVSINHSSSGGVSINHSSIGAVSINHSSSGAVSINHSSSGAVSINHSSSGAVSINHSSSGEVSINHSSSGAVSINHSSNFKEIQFLFYKTNGRNSETLFSTKPEIVAKRIGKNVHQKTLKLRKKLQPQSQSDGFLSGRKLLAYYEMLDSYDDALASALTDVKETHAEDNMMHSLDDDLVQASNLRNPVGFLDDRVSNIGSYEEFIEIPENYVKMNTIMTLQDLQAEKSVDELRNSLRGNKGRHKLGKRAAETKDDELKENYPDSSLDNLTDDQKQIFLGSSMSAARKLLVFGLNTVWGDWASWSKCSSVCEKGGFSVRRRACQTLPNFPCDGTNFEVMPCNVGVKCRARFTVWGVWGPCSVTCGEGVRARSRVCVTEDKNVKCRGMSSLLERCEAVKCEKTTTTPEPDIGPFLNSRAAAIRFNPGKGHPRYYLLQNLMSFFMNRKVTPSPKRGKSKAGVVKNADFEVSEEIPEPPISAPPANKGRLSSPVRPYIWGQWGEFSYCTSSCGTGHRTRQRLCIDNSHTISVKVLAKWCGRGVQYQSIGCVASCDKPLQHTDEGQMPSKIKIIESGSRRGPHVISHNIPGKEMKMSRAEVVETGGPGGPNVITSQDTEKNGPLIGVEVVENGNNNSGPIVLTSHDMGVNEASMLPEPELELPPETIVLIVLSLLCVVLLIAAFCIYFYQSVKESRELNRLKEAQLSFKQDEANDNDVGAQPEHGVVKSANTTSKRNEMPYQTKMVKFKSAKRNRKNKKKGKNKR